MSDPNQTGPAAKPPAQPGVPNQRAVLLGFGIGAIVIAVAAVWFVMAGRPNTDTRERAIRESMGLAQREDIVFAYPLAHAPIAFEGRCDMTCAERQLPAGFALARTGPRPQGWIGIDAPPVGCALLTVRFSPESAQAITDEPLPIYIDAAPIGLLQDCNPDAPVRRNEGGLVQLPPWSRSTSGVAISIPLSVIVNGTTYRIAVCARMADGTIGQFAGDETGGDIRAEMSTYCDNI